MYDDLYDYVDDYLEVSRNICGACDINELDNYYNTNCQVFFILVLYLLKLLQMRSSRWAYKDVRWA